MGENKDKNDFSLKSFNFISAYLKGRVYLVKSDINTAMGKTLKSFI